MGLAAALRPFAVLSARTVLWTTLITGCVFASYAFHAISSTPSYIQVRRQFQRILSPFGKQKQFPISQCIILEDFLVSKQKMLRHSLSALQCISWVQYARRCRPRRRWPPGSRAGRCGAARSRWPRRRRRLAPPLGRRGEARRALSVLAVLASFTSSLALFAILVYINYMLGTWRSCKALSRASSVAWQLVGLVLQLIALALALVNPPSVPDQRGSLVSLCGNISHI